MHSFNMFFITLASLLQRIATAPAPAADQQVPFDWTLIPAHDHMLDALSLRHLQPSKSIELFFEAEQNAGTYAFSIQEQIFHTVVLEHSAYIQHVFCTDDQEIVLIFDSATATSYARQWPSSDFVLITNHETCNRKDERGTYMVNGAWEGSQEYPLQVRAKIVKVGWQDVTDTLELKYGMKPQNDTQVDAQGKEKRDAPACDVSRRSRSACGGAICGRQGYVTEPRILWRTSAASRDSEEACAQACLADINCASFDFHRKTGFCSAFNVGVKSQGFTRGQSELYFFDRECWQASESCGFSELSDRVLPSRSVSGNRAIGYSTNAVAYGDGVQPARSSASVYDNLPGTSGGERVGGNHFNHGTAIGNYSPGRLFTDTPQSDFRQPVRTRSGIVSLTISSGPQAQVDGSIATGASTTCGFVSSASSGNQFSLNWTTSSSPVHSVTTVSSVHTSPSNRDGNDSIALTTYTFFTGSHDHASSASHSQSSIQGSVSSSSSMSASEFSSLHPLVPATSSASITSTSTSSVDQSSTTISSSLVATTSAIEAASFYAITSSRHSSSASSSQHQSSSSSSWSTHSSSSVHDQVGGEVSWSSTGNSHLSTTNEPSMASFSSSMGSASPSEPASTSSTDSRFSSSASGGTSPTTSSLSVASILTLSASDSHSSLLPSIAHTLSEPASMLSSATSSAPSSEHSLNDYELYLFSLFYEGITERDGYIIADLGENGTSNPTLGIDRFDVSDQADQARLRQRGIDAELPTDEECFALISAGLAAAAGQRWTGAPSNTKETLPPHFELSSKQPFQKRTIVISNSTDLIVAKPVVDKRFLKKIMDIILGSVVNALIDPILQAICPVCHQVWDFYNKITDPVFLIGQVCEPCRPVLNIVSAMTDPVGYAKDVLDWFFTYGRYDPKGSRFPPPLPERPPPPPPIVASAQIIGSIDMALPSQQPLGRKEKNWQPNDVLWCLDCKVQVPNIVVVGTVAFSVQEKRIIKAEYDIDMHSSFTTMMQMRVEGSQKFWGSISAGSRYLGSVRAHGLFSIDLEYTHIIAYDISSSGDTDITFGLAGETGRGRGKVELVRGTVQSPNGWEPKFDIRYPSLGAAMAGHVYLSTQGVVNVHTHVMDAVHTQTIVTNTFDLGIHARVIWPSDVDAGRPEACAIGETQVDAWVGAETRLIGASIQRTEQPLGRRCFQLKSLVDQAGAPPQPYCGGRVDRNWFKHGKATYWMMCSFMPSGDPLPEYRDDITTFDQCLTWCNTRADCLYASWEFRDYPLKCRLYPAIWGTQASWWNLFVEKTDPGPPPPPPPSIPPRPPATASRPPIKQTTLPPAVLFPFATPAGAPPVPVPTDYPPRNPEGWCGDLREGSHTIDVDPLDVEYDIECGTIIDYTGITLTSHSQLDFETCLYQCRYYSTDCQAVMYMQDQSEPCIILTSYNAQRYSTDEKVALGIKVRSGAGVNWRKRSPIS